MIRGLDVSAVQGLVPFGALHGAGYAFVIIRCQIGNDGRDANYDRNVGAVAAGITPFAYCFAYPLLHLDPKEQARLFVAAVGKLRDRPIFLDFEWPAPNEWATRKLDAQQIARWLQLLAAEVTTLTGIKPVLYTYPYWWKALIDGRGDVSWANEYPLWLAAYVKTEPKETDSPDCRFTFGKNTRLPPPWIEWLFWQWDGNGGARMPNGTDADFCVFNGDALKLASLIQEAAPDTKPSPISTHFDLNTVRGLQTRLAALGFDPGPIDGIRGPLTISAIRAFQHARGLVSDGIVGPKTRAALAS